MKRLHHEYAALAIEIGAAARRAVKRADVASERVRRYRETLLPLRKKITHRTQLQYNAMQLGVFQLLQSKQKKIATTSAYIDELLNYWIARIKIEQIRYGNLSAMDYHPIHLHGYAFKIIGSDGGWAADKSKLLPETTVLVQVGSAKVIEFVADNPGDWLFHCHMTHHVMNQMGHDFPNMIAVDSRGVDKKIRKLIPGYMTMGTAGMRDMTKTGMPLPENSIPMLGYTGQFGQTVVGSMANILKVREDIDSYEDPGPYAFPEGTVSRRAGAAEMKADGITVDVPTTLKEMGEHNHIMENNKTKKE